MTLMVNAQTGQMEDIPDPEVHNAFLNGSHGFKRGSVVEVTNPDGKGGTLPVENLGEALTRGYSILTDSQKKDQELQKKYGEGFLNQLQGTAQQALRTAIPGFDWMSVESQKVLQPAFERAGIKPPQTPEELQEELRERKARLSPVANITGTAAGFLAPSGAPSLAGKAAAKAIAKVLPKTIAEVGKRTLAKRILTSAAREGIEVALPMAVYGAGEEISEQVLGDPEFASEAILSKEGLSNILRAGAKEAGYGLLLGGAIGAAGPLAKAALKAKPIQKGIVGMKSVGELVSRAPEKLKNLEDLFVIKSTGAMKPQMKLIESQNIAGGSLENVKNIIVDEGLLLPGRSFEVRKEAASKAQEMLGKKLGNIVSQMDDVAKKEGKLPQFDSIYENVYQKTIRPLKESDLVSEVKIGDKLEKELSILKAKWQGKEIPITELINFRRKLGKTVYKGAGPKMSTYKAYLDDVRRSFKEVENQVADDLASQLPIAKEYVDTKTRWQVVDWVNHSLQNKVESEWANNFLSLGDRLGIYGGGVIGALTAPGAALTGAATGAISRGLRTRGASIGAYTLNKLNNLRLAQESVLSLKKEIKDGVGAFLNDTKIPSLKPASISILKDTMIGNATKNRIMDFNVKAAEINNYNQNPQMFISQLSNYLTPLTQNMPTISQQANIKILSAIDQLKTSLPKNPNPDPLGMDTNYYPPDSEISKWERNLRISENPQSILRDLHQRSITPDQIETLSTMYPMIYKTITEELLLQVGEDFKNLPEDKRYMIQMFLRSPTSKYQQPQFINQMQMNFNQSQTTQGGLPPKKPTQSGLGKINTSERVTTDAQKALISLP